MTFLQTERSWFKQQRQKPIVNSSGFNIPPFGCIEITGEQSHPLGGLEFIAGRPSASGVIYWFNGPTQIDNTHRGFATADLPATALIASGVSAQSEVGPVNGAFEMNDSGNGYQMLGARDASGRARVEKIGGGSGISTLGVYTCNFEFTSGFNTTTIELPTFDDPTAVFSIGSHDIQWDAPARAWKSVNGGVYYTGVKVKYYAPNPAMGTLSDPALTSPAPVMCRINHLSIVAPVATARSEESFYNFVEHSIPKTSYSVDFALDVSDVFSLSAGEAIQPQIFSDAYPGLTLVHWPVTSANIEIIRINNQEWT